MKVYSTHGGSPHVDQSPRVQKCRLHLGHSLRMNPLSRKNLSWKSDSAMTRSIKRTLLVIF